jgi:hypothetical protein
LRILASADELRLEKGAARSTPTTRDPAALLDLLLTALER